ncbi:hypothetical protein SD37_11680 [Amycolatopsis orientalis]|uniref:Uncharacterized protein n=1 Tax=Amycolatopsis orientalis TaxID=31958 RepID=A0A193BVP1_AMYOR|nr:hypothetical protein [Amycolatopsis orientalis]ANN16238.1 hypothetical protein SD37_11680 [Amycolatopsis orientalis]
MTKDTHTRAIPIRIPPERWKRFEETAGARNRSAVINNFIAWHNREPGAEFPERPPAPPVEDGGAD